MLTSEKLSSAVREVSSAVIRMPIPAARGVALSMTLPMSARFSPSEGDGRVRCANCRVCLDGSYHEQRGHLSEDLLPD